MGLLEASMHSEKRAKMVQVWVVIVRVGVAVMCKGVLVLPHDGIAQERHAPDGHVVDPGSTTGRKMARVVAQCSNQPAKDCKEETPNDTSLKD